MEKEYKADWLFIIILGVLSMLTPLAIDMYLPSFGDIALDLSVSEEKIQTTLALFTFGFAIGQLLWGPLSDTYGRKPIIIIGIVVAAVISFVITQIKDIHHFYFLRFIQGFFGASPAVVAGALLRDLFKKNEFARMMSMIMIVMMIAPLIAPILGGYLAKWFHWHSIFYVLMWLGLLCALLVFVKIPETLSKENRSKLDFKTVLHNYANLLKKRQVLGYILSNSFSYAGMFCFLTSGSLVYTGIYGVAKENFGYFFILNIGIMMLATALNGKYITKIGTEKALQIGLGIQVLAGIWLFICGFFQLGLWPMAIGIAIFVGMVSVVSSSANASILELFPKTAGTANSITGMIRFGAGSLVGSILAFFPVTSERPMLYAIGISISIAIFSYITMVKKVR
ncbi:MAG: Bcr/CflA family multidrug efflux MFS transporter [Capnocytophaga sp.]|nr:Bcr/CflA family multidrug efflux MFS transporter [Capnocytophaga sp.]